MKEAIAIVGAVFAAAYVVVQVLLALLQPLFTAFTGKLH